ncbi:MAG: CidA/LrgA family protein [Gammaproteobacteria bacterium]|nr:CidA/LrgA family protein [Gammaproteobacteria bacterium]MCP5196054.1 CidA/LrgA family protein [Gammaproteobacteria bacterium]
MIAALATLLIFQLIGEIAVQLSGLPVPGPVVGMLLLFLALRWCETLPDALRTTAETLLSHLSLLFIPAGVGIIQYGARLTNEWLALVAAMVLGTLTTVAVTALIMQGVIHLQRRSNGINK